VILFNLALPPALIFASRRSLRRRACSVALCDAASSAAASDIAVVVDCNVVKLRLDDGLVCRAARTGDVECGMGSVNTFSHGGLTRPKPAEAALSSFLDVKYSERVKLGSEF
jgi:hypothetical protein